MAVTDSRPVRYLNLGIFTSTGAGNALRLPEPLSRHTVQVLMGGTVVATAVTVDFEGSIDNVNWFQLARHVLTAAEISAESAMFSVVDMPVSAVRANPTTLTGGTSPNLTIDCVSI